MIESSKYLKPWREHVARTARALGHTRPLPGAAAVDLMFVMPRPKSLPKSRPTPPATKRPDVDKLARGILDALHGLTWLDDSNVVDLRSRKRIAEPTETPGVHISYRDAAAVPQRPEQAGLRAA